MKKVFNIFRALGDKTRIEICKFIANGGKTVTSIVERFHLTQPTISHHLKVLQNAGLIKSHKEKKWKIYSLNLTLIKKMGYLLLSDLGIGKEER